MEDIEAQIRRVACLRSHSKLVAETRAKSGHHFPFVLYILFYLLTWKELEVKN